MRKVHRCICLQEISTNTNRVSTRGSSWRFIANTSQPSTGGSHWKSDTEGELLKVHCHAGDCSCCRHQQPLEGVWSISGSDTAFQFGSHAYGVQTVTAILRLVFKSSIYAAGSEWLEMIVYQCISPKCSPNHSPQSSPWVQSRIQSPGIAPQPFVFVTWDWMPGCPSFWCTLKTLGILGTRLIRSQQQLLW